MCPVSVCVCVCACVCVCVCVCGACVCVCVPVREPKSAHKLAHRARVRVHHREGEERQVVYIDLNDSLFSLCPPLARARALSLALSCPLSLSNALSLRVAIKAAKECAGEGWSRECTQRVFQQNPRARAELHQIEQARFVSSLSQPPLCLCLMSPLCLPVAVAPARSGVCAGCARGG